MRDAGLLLTAALMLMPAAASAQADALGRLGWLAGCWTRIAAPGLDAGSGEQWTAAAGGAMLGLARTVRGGRTVEHEFMRIHLGGDGRLLYSAQPSGQAPADFALLRQGENEIVFENPRHDFPQRIVYRLEAPGRLLARIEGQRGGAARTIDFALQRSACDGDSTARKATAMSTTTMKISGEFEVTMQPQAAEAHAAGPGRMGLDKRYHGALEASAIGQMLALRTAVQGSAGYVAIETVSGTLAGRRGSFALQHSGTMDRGTPFLTIGVIPDSGTEQLQGLKGQMQIRIEGGKHFYDFEYQLPEAGP
ncbi:DUF6265 family protein [Roseateles violae]|uniref:DUF6265 family protein n=1 Tax=Roseateles violae TaxID=3058042 RepID=A0ABT8DV55_9BURK|nr:DUF6265 family protein [Pelomonas sp. PFR6]MDN3922013.1 DUF6265 family protein [Pelomonas sp. PFR6]